MSDNRKVGVVIPTYMRMQQTIDSFAQVIDDDRVESVTIVDDASTDDSFERLWKYFEGNEKVRITRNKINLDCYRNKHRSVVLSNSQNIILLDSDNTIGKDYLDAIYAIENWDEKTVYQPTFAYPHFNFKEWSGLTLTKENVAQYADTHLMTSLNAQNHFINREEYLRVWNGSVNPGSSDSIFFSTTWLEAGNIIYMTPNLEYYHHIASDKSGHYNQNSHLYRKFHEQLMNKIRNLK